MRYLFILACAVVIAIGAHLVAHSMLVGSPAPAYQRDDIAIVIEEENRCIYAEAQTDIAGRDVMRFHVYRRDAFRNNVCPRRSGVPMKDDRNAQTAFTI